MKRNPLPAIVLVVIILAVVTAAFLGDKASKAEPPPPAAAAESRPEGAPYDAWLAAETFMAAFQSTDPAVREAGFRATAVTDLAEGLMMTAPEHVVTDQRQSMTVVGGSPYANAFDITFANHPDVRVTFVADPTAEYDWRATDVTKK